MERQRIAICGAHILIAILLSASMGCSTPSKRSPAAAPPPVKTAPIVPAGPQIGPATGMVMEAVHIDQTTLGSRPGYKANFIGSGKLSVALPKIPAALKSKVATLTGKSGQSELKYFNYSVVMNKERKLAFFSVVNVDGGQQQDVGKREGDSWLRDPRIDTKLQIGDEFFVRLELAA